MTTYIMYLTLLATTYSTFHFPNIFALPPLPAELTPLICNNYY